MVTNSDIVKAFSISFMFLAFMIVLSMLLNTLIIFYCPESFNKPSYHRPTLYFQLTSILSFILGIACILCDTIHVTTSWMTSMSLLDAHFIPLRLWSNSFSFYSYVFTDLVILGRLYYTFKDSVYRLSRITIWILTSLLTIIIICDLMYILTFIPPFRNVQYLPRISLLTSLIVETILSLCMTYLFSYKLHQLLKPSHSYEQESKLKEVSKSYLDHTSMTRSQRITSSSDEFLENSFIRDCINTQFELNQQQQSLVDLCTKHAIITGVAAIYFFMRFSYRQFAFMYDDYFNLQLIWVSCYLSRTYVFVANGIAVYYGFVFATNGYYMLFGRCHLCVGHCCARIAKREIAHSAMNKIMREYLETPPVTIELKNDISVERVYRSYHTLTPVGD